MCFFVAEIFSCQEFNFIFKIAGICEIVHNGSLIIDDIEDDSLTRRSQKCIHKIYGLDRSINAANFMYYCGMDLITKNQFLSSDMKFQLLDIYIDEMKNTHIG